MFRRQYSKSTLNCELMRYERQLISIALLLVLILGSFSPSAAAPAFALSSPTPLKPDNGITITATGYSGSQSDPPAAIPEFSWIKINGTTRYRLQLSQDIAFSTKIEFTTPHTHFIPTNVNQFNDGIWYWRVRVDAPSAGNYSEIRSFTRQWTTADNNPQLSSPGEGATLEFFDAPTFSWQPVIGAASYRFQIASSADGFNTPIYNQTTLAVTHQPTAKLANGDYYWRVVPLDPGNREGTPSASRSFTIAYNRVSALLEPANNSFPSFTPTFRWSAVRGAQQYQLQYSTDPTLNTGVTTVNTRNTTFTPSGTLPNDVNYYWRVRAHSGNSISDWSVTWTFRKQWYIQPVLLTPVNNYQYVRFPIFSWTPVPGASKYKFEMDTGLDFTGAGYQFATTSNTFYTPDKYEGFSGVRYWRVTPYDRNNNAGKTSNVSSYVSFQEFASPHLVYPFYYYTPNDFPPPDAAVSMLPHEDRTMPLPIFIWHRLTPYPDGGIYANAYRLQVSSDPLFLSVDWSVDTENTSATPTTSNPFVPDSGDVYYWRVRPLDGVGGSMIGEWSQVWKTRIDTSGGLAPQAGSKPALIRPEMAAELVEATPLLEWWPLQGADSYEVQISLDSDFSSILTSTTVPYPAYSPTAGLAQRSLGLFNYGTYYWRVRALAGGNPLGMWSDVQRFQIASQSDWVRTRTIGDPSNQLLIGSDPDDTSDDNYELTTLFAAQDANYWYFGFNATIDPENMTYALYLDLDHRDGSGASSDARGLNVATTNAHKPEYAVYVIQTSGSLSADLTAIYAWNVDAWGTPQTLSSVGGQLYYDGASNYVELQIPNTAIGMQDTTGSYAVSLFSTPSASGSQPVDTVPSDPTFSSIGTISRFASASERMDPIMPPNGVGGDPTTFSSVPPFFWDYPAGSNPYTPWAGALMRVYLDAQFTTQVAEFKLTSNSAYYASTAHAWAADFDGDNTYYWRIKPRYLDGGEYLGTWSQGWHFERQGFVPDNLQESVHFATPTFSWDLVEGAESYDLQVDNDPNFGSPEISANTAQVSYTPSGTLANGTYYWRVRIRRNGGIINEWSPSKTFVLTLPKPAGLSPDDPNAENVIGRAPTLCWEPLLEMSDGTAILAAYKYKIQISRGDPTFSSIYDSTETEQSCWTPTKGYHDGKYYWRVAMIDGQGRLSEYSLAAEFTKQYPRAVPKSPTSGSLLTETPTFVWTQEDGITPYVHGAASYQLEVSLNDTFSPLYDSVKTNNTRYTPTKVYASGNTYYWRVAIVDKDGRIGPFSDATIILEPEPEAGKNKIFLPLAIR
jgi:hypothetical protein